MKENENQHPPEVLFNIGKQVIELVPDNATLKFGWSPLVYTVFPFLHQRQNLGLHTDVFTETMFRLQEAGIITNSMKQMDTGRTVVTHAHGSQELYDFLDRNPAVEFQPADYLNDPKVLGKIKNLTCIEGALKVSLSLIHTKIIIPLVWYQFSEKGHSGKVTFILMSLLSLSSD